MKRRPFKLALLLLLGAIVNVAVAWGVTWGWASDNATSTRLGNARAGLSDSDSPSEDDLKWLARACFVKKPDTEASQFVIVPFTYEQAALRQRLYFQFRRLKPGFDGRVKNIVHPEVIRSDTGWPALTLSDALFTDRTGGVHRLDRWLHPQGLVLYDASDRVALPLCPIWPGFTINTIFYAAILWVLFAAPLAYRRHRRIKRSRCPACAYPVGTSPVCTECGGTLPLPREGQSQGEGA